MTSVDTNNAEKNLFFVSEKQFPIFFPPIFGVIGLQVHDEPKRTSPSRLAREKMVVDLIGWSQGAQNAEK